MSWLARSLANSLRIDDDDGYNENDVVQDPPSTSPRNFPQQPLEDHNAVGSQIEIENEDETQDRGGVKEDLDEIKQTLTRQFWGMASFLAPPPTASESDPSSFIPNHSDHSASVNEQQQQQQQQQKEEEEEEEQQQPQKEEEEEQQQHQQQQEQQHQRLDDDGVSSNQSSEMEQSALRADDADPNTVEFGSDLEGNGESEYVLQPAVGITEEVLTFALNIAMHPETWLDFPIDEEDDTEDFDMSDAQQHHAAVIERLAPRLAALRIELCPCHMSEGYFWKVYFVLLHSRLNKQDAGILSSPQVMAARAMWMQELHKQTKPEFEFFGRSASFSRDNAQHHDFTPSLLDNAYSDDTPRQPYGYGASLSMMADNESENKYAVESSGANFSDKSVTEENPVIKTENKDIKSGRPSQIIIQDYDDDGDDDWPDDGSDLGVYSGATLSLVNEEDISFSDLEDDDYGIKPLSTITDSRVV